MELRPLEWDSNLFGIEVGRIDFRQDDSTEDLIHLLENSTPCKLIYVVCEDQLPELELREGTFSKLDTKVDFYSPVQNVAIKTRIEEWENGAESLRQKLYEMAFIAGEQSRFNRDPQLKRDQFQALYRIWVDRSLDGSIADQVYIAYSEAGEPAGMMTTKREKSGVRIGLLAVLPEFQGSGIGRNLVHKALELSNKEGAEGVYVATQEENISACRFYHSLGFKISTRTHIYHYWNS